VFRLTDTVRCARSCCWIVPVYGLPDLRQQRRLLRWEGERELTDSGDAWAGVTP
jgi:hypothetical protein